MFERTVSARTAAAPRRSNCRRLNVEALDARDVPATFYVTSGDDSGPGTLRDALNTMDQNVPNQIIIEVHEIRLDSQLYAYDSAGVEIDSDRSTAGQVDIEPSTPAEYGQFRFLTSGIADSGITTLNGLLVMHFGTNGDGGAVLNLGLRLNVDMCSFHYNTAAGNGGAIASTPGLQLNITDSGADHNSAGGYGGFVYFAPNGNDQSLSITDSGYNMSDYGYNSAQLGGAVYSVTNGTVYIQASAEFNTARNGAAFYLVGGVQQVDISGNYQSVTDNFSTSTDGPTGAVYSLGAASVWIASSSFGYGYIANNSPNDGVNYFDVYVAADSLASAYVRIYGTTNVPMS